MELILVGLAAVASKTLGSNIGNYLIKEGKIILYYTRYKNFKSFNNKLTLIKLKVSLFRINPVENNFNIKELTISYKDLEIVGSHY